jgi:hypothetical protein
MLMSEPIKVDLDAIEAAAKAATQGEWQYDEFRMGGVVRGGPVQHWVNGSGQSQIAMSTGAEWMEPGEPDANAKHMATANPAVVLELVRRLRAIEGKVSVDADALRHVLQALIGPDHHIRELQACRRLPDSPIDKLITEFNAQAQP